MAAPRDCWEKWLDPGDKKVKCVLNDGKGQTRRRGGCDSGGREPGGGGGWREEQSDSKLCGLEGPFVAVTFLIEYLFSCHLAHVISKAGREKYQLCLFANTSYQEGIRYRFIPKLPRAIMRYDTHSSDGMLCLKYTQAQRARADPRAVDSSTAA